MKRSACWERWHQLFDDFITVSLFLALCKTWPSVSCFLSLSHAAMASMVKSVKERVAGHQTTAATERASGFTTGRALAHNCERRVCSCEAFWKSCFQPVRHVFEYNAHSGIVNAHQLTRAFPTLFCLGGFVNACTLDLLYFVLAVLNPWMAMYGTRQPNSFLRPCGELLRATLKPDWWQCKGRSALK